MSDTLTAELPEGPRILGHAIGHACATWGGCVDDYADILRAALHGRHRAPATTRSIVSDYAVTRARELIAQAESGALDPVGSDQIRAEWIGAATAIMQEFIRHA